MLPELSLSSFSKSENNSISFPIPKPISFDIVKELIHQKLDQIPLGLYHIKIFLLCALLFITQGFELALVFFQRYHYSQDSYMQIQYYADISKGWFILGQALGAVLFSIITMHKGRQVSFRILIILYCFSSFSIYFIRNQERLSYQKTVYIMMNVFRCLLGFFIGGVHMSIYSIIDEITPKKWRGKANMVILSLCIPLGMLLLILMKYICELFLSSFSNQIFNLLRLIPVIFTFPLLFIDPLYLSSPRWELFIGKFRDAQRIMQFITNENDDHIKNTARTELTSDKKVIPNLIFNRRYFWSLNAMKCVQVQYKRSIYCISLLIVFSLYQYMFTFIANLALIEENTHLSNLPSISLSNLKPCVFHITNQLIGGIIITLFIDIFNRKTNLIIIMGLMALSSIAFGLNRIFSFIPSNYQIIIISVFINAGSGLNIAFSLLSELFPFEFHIQIMCFGYSIWLLIGEGSIFVLYWFTVYNVLSCLYLSYGIICLITIFLIHFTGVNTGNISLEQLNNNIIMSDFTEIANISKI